MEAIAGKLYRLCGLAQFCQWVPDAKWPEMLTAPHLNIATALFEKGVFQSLPTMPLFLNFFAKQPSLEPLQLNSLINGAYSYVDPLVGELNRLRKKTRSPLPQKLTRYANTCIYKIFR